QRLKAAANGLIGGENWSTEKSQIWLSIRVRVAALFARPSGNMSHGSGKLDEAQISLPAWARNHCTATVPGRARPPRMAQNYAALGLQPELGYGDPNRQEMPKLYRRHDLRVSDPVGGRS